MKRILIIDDDIDILASLQRLLSINNFEVDITSKWHDVFDKIGSFKPNLIILDVFLAGIDGRNICKQLKRENITRQIPVLMFSGNESVADNIISYGADDFISKPVNLPVLLTKIDGLLKSHEAK